MTDARISPIGFACYAEINVSLFRRIEPISEIDGNYRTLEFGEPAVMDAIIHTTASATLVYVEPKGPGLRRDNAFGRDPRLITCKPESTVTVDSNCRSHVSMAVI